MTRFLFSRAALCRLGLVLLIFAALLFQPKPAFADTTSTVQVWAPIYFTHPLGEKWKAMLTVFPLDVGGDNPRFLVLPQVGYNLTPHTTLWGGYAHNEYLEDKSLDEERIYEQITYDKSFKKMDLSIRGRVEQRDFQNKPGVGVRSRLLVKTTFPIGKSKKWGFVTGDEIIWNWAHVEGAADPGLEQNRVMVGFSRKLNSRLKVESVYMFRYLNVLNNKPNHIDHVWMTSLGVKL